MTVSLGSPRPRIRLGSRRLFARVIPFRLFPSGTQTFEPSPGVRAESTGGHQPTLRLSRCDSVWREAVAVLLLVGVLALR